MKVWITKYALKTGTFETEAEICAATDVNMISYKTRGMFHDYAHGEGRNWHRTKESADTRVRLMANRKIELLRKQIEKLEAIAESGNVP